MSRPQKKPDFDPNEQMQHILLILSEAYDESVSFRTLAAEFDMTLLKVRKLLITAGVYSSDISDEVNELHGSGKSIAEIMEQTGLSRTSVHSYLPYKKGIYNRKELSLDAQRCRTYRERKKAVDNLKKEPSEGALWQAIVAFQNYSFRTSSGLPFHYILKTGRNGEWTKELWIDRRENSKSLAWSSILLAFQNAMSISDETIPGPKSLGNIRGVSYIYPMLWRFGVIKVPEEIEDIFVRWNRYQKFPVDTI